jgi:hypothetical protein
MKFILPFLVSLLVCFSIASAQTYADYEDVVYLKNGSIIHGVIIEQIPNEKIKIQSGKNVFVFTFDEIEKLTKEKIGEESAAQKSGTQKDFGHRPKGFVFHYELGMSDYIASKNIPMFAFLLTHGYQINPHLLVGFSAGADVSIVNAYNIPAYCTVRGYLLKNRVTPYAEMGLGYNLTLASRSSGLTGSKSTLHGFLVNPNFGVRYALNEKLGLSLALGYKFIGAASRTGSWSRYKRTFNAINAVTLRLGVLF